MRATRAFAAIAVLALVAGACSGSTPTAAPSSGAGAQRIRGRLPGGRRIRRRLRPANTPIAIGGRRPRPARPRSAGTAASAAATRRSRSTVEKQVVEKFNASHPDIHVTFEAVPYAGANDALATEIASGNGPDIVGPVGIGGANAFHGQWLDLAPLIQKNNYDLSGFPQDAVDIYKLDEGQVGIPFAIYPSVLFYAKSLFDEAGLAYPPHKYGDKYTMPDGSVVDWNYDTITQGRQDPDRRQERQGRHAGRLRPRQHRPVGLRAPARRPARPGRLLRRRHAGGGRRQDRPDPGPVEGRPGSSGTTRMWKDHVSMTGPIFSSPDINPEDYPFFTGKIAMSENFLWSTYGLEGLEGDWDMGIIPSYNGQVTSAFNADTFRILKDTKHPDEAFTVLSYLLGEGAPDLLAAYGGMPARTADQAAFFEGQNETFTQKPDWQVAIDSIQFADNPNFESFMPAYNETLGLVGSGGKYTTKWQTDQGLDMDQEFESLRSEIQAIWDKQ